VAVPNSDAKLAKDGLENKGLKEKTNENRNLLFISILK
jgi:hypothetical protein